MISLDDMRPAWRRPTGAQQRRLPLRHKRLAKIIDLAKNLDDPIQHHRLHHSAMAAYLKKLFRHNPLVARKPLIRVWYFCSTTTARGWIGGTADQAVSGTRESAFAGFWNRTDAIGSAP